MKAISYIIKKWNGKGYDENSNIIYELINGNGKVKEYDINTNHVFEGQYLNGKEMKKEKILELCFEIGREYLNGLKHGKGKEYNPDGSISFESEYLNGKINGKAKVYEIVN